MKKLYILLNIISLILIVCFGIMVIYDYINYDVTTSFPFYAYIIYRSITFLIPSLILFIISRFIKKNYYIVKK